MPPQAFTDMGGTLDKVKVRKAVLIYLSQRIQPGLFARMQECCLKRDTQKTGHIEHKLFLEACTESGMPVGEREFQELLIEIDPKQTGHVSYE